MKCFSSSPSVHQRKWSKVKFDVKSQPCCMCSHSLLLASHRATEKNPPTTAANFSSYRSPARSPPALFVLQCRFWKRVGEKTDTVERMLFHLLRLARTKALYIVDAWIMAVWCGGGQVLPFWQGWHWRADPRTQRPFPPPPGAKQVCRGPTSANHHWVLIKTYLGQVITLPRWQEEVGQRHIPGENN